MIDDKSDDLFDDVNDVEEVHNEKPYYTKL